MGGAVVEYFIEMEDTVMRKAFIKDVSPDGICIFIPEKAEKGMIICMNIYLPGTEEAITAKGKVVWRHEGDYYKLYTIGIEFTQITEEAKKVLDGYGE